MRHGEYELGTIGSEWIQFGLIGILGFLPLGIVHFASRRTRLETTPEIRPGRAMWRLAAIKTSLLIVLADWFTHLV